MQSCDFAEIILAKHRNGPQGLVKLYFRGECTKFINLNEETEEPDLDDGENVKYSEPEKVELQPIQDTLSQNSIEDDVF